MGVLRRSRGCVLLMADKIKCRQTNGWMNGGDIMEDGERHTGMHKERSKN